MAKRAKPDGNIRGYPNFDRVPLTALKKSRRGKHHELMGKIMEDLQQLESGYAVRIPLEDTNKVAILKLRSAIVRAAAKENIRVTTSSDGSHFYVWKRA